MFIFLLVVSKTVKLNNTSAFVKDNFYILTFEEKELELIYLAILNSSFSRYFIENCGRSYGSGLLKIQKYELEGLFVLNHKYLIKNDYNSLYSLAKLRMLYTSLRTQV